jgi:murein hydrolase activator
MLWSLGTRRLWPGLTLIATVAGLAFVCAVPVRGTGETPSSTPGPQAGAPSFDDRLAHVQESRRRIEHDIERFRREERSLLRDVEGLELEVRLRSAELREVQIVLARTNAQLDVATTRLRELEQSVALARPVVAARARALYKQGSLSYLRLLLSIEKPAAMLQGYRYITALARRDKDRIAALRRDLEALARTREELATRTQEAQTLRSEIEHRRQRLRTERVRKEAFLVDLVARKEVQTTYVEELRSAEERLRGLLDGLSQGDVSVPIVALKGALPWPVTGPVRSHFGRRKHPRFDTYTIQHGIEIEAPPEAAVKAVHEGTVVFADRFLGFGLMIVVDHGDRHMSLYAHLAESLVAVGQQVVAGRSLGTVGEGLSGAALYFEFRTQGRPEDPLDWLRKGPL